MSRIFHCTCLMLMHLFHRVIVCLFLCAQAVGDDSRAPKSTRRMYVGQQISFRRDHMELARPIKDGVGA